jgi:hypothetical protein
VLEKKKKKKKVINRMFGAMKENLTEGVRK